MRTFSPILVVLALAVTACEATTGEIATTSSTTCEPMAVSEVSVNWAVFGPVTKAVNCPGERNQYQERYNLTNGWGVYQQANADYVYFNEVNERAFREALGYNKAFADKATSIKLHYPKLKNRPTIFAQTRASGQNVIIFKMNSGHYGHGGDQEVGWSILHSGFIYDDGDMSPEEFRQYFLERLKVFVTP